MPSSTVAERYVNLGKTRTVIQGPDGQTIVVLPFDDVFHEFAHKRNGTYVLEGEFWRRYVSTAGPLHPFPRPEQFGRTSFPPLVARHASGVLVDVETGAAVSSPDSLAALAASGKIRLAGDVLTPEGKIRRTLPNGEIELVDDTPENRTRLSEESGVVNERNPQIRDGITAWLERMHVSTAEEFAALSDDVLLKIPGVSHEALPHIRANMTEYLRAKERLAAVIPTPPGETAATATRSIDDLFDDSADAVDAPVPKKKKAAKKKATKRKAAD
jgi:hypothetical protein